MTKRLLVSSILLGLTALLPSAAAFAQVADADQDDKKRETKLDEIVVTGSLIPRAQIETASPVITLSTKDLTTHGFRNVYDALHTMPIATGYVQDNQVASQGSFAPGATTISLFGLSPGFTLILLNGHPMADYPAPYNGIENITDLSTIPIEIVDHIDILSGGQSSLYGSAAIAGVVNVILKKKIDGTDLAFRVGGYDNGGGTNERLQISGGHSFGDLQAVYSLSLENQQPIRVRQSFFPSRLSNPLGTIAGRDFLQIDPFAFKYVDPGAAACAPSSQLFGGTLVYSHRAGSGNYCGSLYDVSNATLLNGSKGGNAYLGLSYPLNDHVELYGEILYGFTKQLINTGPAFWSYFNPALRQSANGFSGDYWNTTLQNFESSQRYFAPEEMGGVDANAEKLLTRQYNVNLGVRGSLGGDWQYDLYYNRSQITTFDSQRWPLTQPFNDYYLGAEQGGDPYGYGFDAFATNTARLYKPLTPAQFDAMTALVQSRALTWQQNVHLTATNTDFFSLPAGPAGIAGIVEVGNQAFNRPVDPRVIAGDFNNLTGNQGSGSRDRFAIGGELQLPIFSTLTADVSARYDSYSYAGRRDSKPTFKLGLEYRPVDTLLVRGNYATAFRAPDMLYIFQGDSGLYSAANDYYLCRLQGFTSGNLTNCPQANKSVFSFYHGSPDLKDITAKTWGIGTVWSPSANFDVKVDYTHISISNEVQVLSTDSVLQTEANCRLGVSEGGQAYDINSALCQGILAQVHRYPADYAFLLAQNELQNVSRFPINIASEVLSGIQASATYRHDFGRYGNVSLSAQYYVELNHKQRNNPGDDYIDLLHNFNSFENKSRSSASVSWSVDHWTSTLYGILYGRNVAYSAPVIVGSWAQFNGSVQYDFDGKASLGLSVNNLTNRAPPVDSSFAGSPAVGPPYYNPYVYNGYGRIYWVEMKVHF